MSRPLRNLLQQTHQLPQAAAPLAPLARPRRGLRFLQGHRQGPAQLRRLGELRELQPDLHGMGGSS